MFAEPNGRPAVSRGWVPPVDILENENELVVKADVPDVKFEDIDVKLENGTLTLRGERKFEKQSTEKGGWHRMERSYGTFERSFTLPETVDPEQVKAKLQKRHADRDSAQERDRQAPPGQSGSKKQLNFPGHQAEPRP